MEKDPKNVYFILLYLSTHIFPANCILENIRKGNLGYSYGLLQNYKNPILRLGHNSLYISEYAEVSVKPSSRFKISSNKIVDISFIFKMPY